MLHAVWIVPGGNAADAYAVRLAVFVEEQGFSREGELDQIDETAHHLVLYNGDARPVATGRLFPDREDASTYVVGRVAVGRTLRGTGAGMQVMAEMARKAASLGARRLVLGAQCQAEAFYRKCGYTPYGEPYLDEHCPHIHMEKLL